MGRLDGRTALVTGAARGIGRATVARLLEEGARVTGVVHTARDVDLGGATVFAADVADAAAMAQAVDAAAARGRLDVCIANAGAFAEYDAFVDADPATWERLVEVNLLGVLVTLQAAARAMVAQEAGGRLLVTSSLAGLRGEPRSPAYGATKGGIHAIVQALAVELAPHGITVNAVAPGQIDTEMNERNMRLLGDRRGQTLAQIRGEWVQRIPARRLGSPDDVAAVFAFLASDEASFITGEVLRVDGGELVSQGPLPSA